MNCLTTEVDAIDDPVEEGLDQGFLRPRDADIIKDEARNASTGN
ncbi:MAG: hypothetical protein P8L39_11725 [Halioglobus sp.]|nr:hypothetical protein [Halioglobus sp.]